jgi:hypothetical protein
MLYARAHAAGRGGRRTCTAVEGKGSLSEFCACVLADAVSMCGIVCREAERQAKVHEAAAMDQALAEFQEQEEAEAAAAQAAARRRLDLNQCAAGRAFVLACFACMDLLGQGGRRCHQNGDAPMYTRNRIECLSSLPHTDCVRRRMLAEAQEARRLAEECRAHEAARERAEQEREFRAAAAAAAKRAAGDRARFDAAQVMGAPPFLTAIATGCITPWSRHIYQPKPAL